MSETQQTTAERISAYLTNALDLSLIGHGDTPTALSVVSSVIAAEIDALTRERDEARADLAEARANLRHAAIRMEGFIVARDDAQAEVERLRPAAEAWEAQEAWANAPVGVRYGEDGRALRERRIETAARAAKGQGVKHG